jgi:hypothetical protein
MPRTGPKSSARLGIELEDPQPVYFPGDTLNGHVTCEEPSEHQSSYSAPRVKLFGRAKTKYTVSTTNGKSIERGRAVFFEELQLLQKGPVAVRMVLMMPGLSQSPSWRPRDLASQQEMIATNTEQIPPTCIPATPRRRKSM